MSGSMKNTGRSVCLTLWRRKPARPLRVKPRCSGLEGWLCGRAPGNADARKTAVARGVRACVAHQPVFRRFRRKLATPTSTCKDNPFSLKTALHHDIEWSRSHPASRCISEHQSLLDLEASKVVPAGVKLAHGRARVWLRCCLRTLRKG